MILTEEQHLQNIANIIKEFAKKYKLIFCYTSMKGTVNHDRRSGEIKFYPYYNFDNYTLREFDKVKGELYETVRKYMEDNNIKKRIRNSYTIPYLGSIRYSSLFQNRI